MCMKLDMIKNCALKFWDWFSHGGVWMSVFCVYALFVAIMNFGGLMSPYQITEVNIALGWLLTVVFIFNCGYYFALGWGKKLYSKKAENIIFYSIIAFILLLLCYVVYLCIPDIVSQLRLKAGPDVPHHTLLMNAIMFAFIIYFFIYLIINIPFIVAHFVYQKYCETFAVVEKSYLKLFFTFLSAMLIISTLFLLIFSDKSQFKFCDYLILLSNIFDIFVLVNYAYGLKVGKQIVWKVLFGVYLILTPILYLCASEHFLYMTRIQLIGESFVALVVGVLLFVGFFYVMYRYAFTKDIYADEIAKIEEQEV